MIPRVRGVIRELEMTPPEADVALMQEFFSSTRTREVLGERRKQAFGGKLSASAECLFYRSFGGMFHANARAEMIIKSNGDDYINLAVSTWLKMIR